METLNKKLTIAFAGFLVVMILISVVDYLVNRRPSFSYATIFLFVWYAYSAAFIIIHRINKKRGITEEHGWWDTPVFKRGHPRQNIYGIIMILAPVPVLFFMMSNKYAWIAVFAIMFLCLVGIFSETRNREQKQDLQNDHES